MRIKKYGLDICLLLLFILASFFVYTLLNRVPAINHLTKTCLVTGASSGIGLEISRNMLKRGWTVIGVARRKNLLKTLDQELGSKFLPYVCDVSSVEQFHAICQDIKARQLEPTLFFLNAGMGEIEQPFETFVDIHKQTFATNYFGVINWIDEWLLAVKKIGGGTFVAISSVASIFSSPGSAGYGASKAAINSCFHALRLQYRNDNIGFVTVLSGPVSTKMLKLDKKIPFVHTAKQEANYIVQQVFTRKKQIEPSWFYAFLMRLLCWLPDDISVKTIY